MSKIGEKAIDVSESTQIKIENHLITVSGKEGELSVSIPRKIEVTRENNLIWVKRKSNDKKTKSLHGLVRSLIFNAVTGVNQLWEKKLKVVGTGYRVKLQEENIVLEVGYSHPVLFKKVEGIDISVEGTNKIIIKGIDKQLVGQVAYQIRIIKKPDPYKGKGIQYEGEKIKLKPGKKEKIVGGTK